MQIRYLGAIRGKDVPETTRRIMSAVMTTAVVRLMNFVGRGGKKAIRDMKILQVIIGMECSVYITHTKLCYAVTVFQ